MKSLITALIFIFALIPSCTKHEHNHNEKTEAKNEEKASDTYTCPMHPQIKKEAPGQCPICGMTLVKVEATTHNHNKNENTEVAQPEAHAAFSLDTSKKQMIGVKLGTVEKHPVFKTINAAGRLAFDPDLYAAQNEFIEAIKQMERVKDSALAEVKQSSKRMLESSRVRLKILGLSDGQIDALEKTDTGDASLLITQKGQTAWVYAEVFEMDLPLVKPGLATEITAGFLGGKTLYGKVLSVDRIINPATRTAKVRIQAQDAQAVLRPESFVNVNIKVPLGNQIAVPFDAVMDTGKQAWVFVVNRNGSYEPRLIKIRFHADDEIAIASGVNEKEKIVISANFLIDSESRLKAVQSASDEKTSPSCPKGQHWDSPMKMCMPDVGN